jgi:hypothetical protein
MKYWENCPINDNLHEGWNFGKESHIMNEKLGNSICKMDKNKRKNSKFWLKLPWSIRLKSGHMEFHVKHWLLISIQTKKLVIA